jgi:hypothetical protein
LNGCNFDCAVRELTRSEAEVFAAGAIEVALIGEAAFDGCNSGRDAARYSTECAIEHCAPTEDGGRFSERSEKCAAEMNTVTSGLRRYRGNVGGARLLDELVPYGQEPFGGRASRWLILGEGDQVPTRFDSFGFLAEEQCRERA